MASPRNWLFLGQLRGELWKLFARKRTYIGFGAYLLIEILILILLQLPAMKGWYERFIEKQGYVAADYYSGLTLGFLIVTWTVYILGPLYLSLVTGDAVAKDVEDGTMRMILSRPVSRLRVVWVRYVAVVIYTLVLCLFISGSALLVGLARNGMGGMFVLAPSQGVVALYDFGPGLHRYLLGIPLMTLSFLTVTSLGFFFSCCNMKPAAATILCLSFYFIDMILHGVPQFASISEYFLTTHMLAWMKIFRPLVPNIDMLTDYTYLLAADGTLLVLGIAVFQTRDFKA